MNAPVTRADWPVLASIKYLLKVFPTLFSNFCPVLKANSGQRHLPIQKRLMSYNRETKSIEDIDAS
jgi:hypothetical protein